MLLEIHGFSEQPYLIAEPDLIETPRLLVFRDRLDRNISRMQEHSKALDARFSLAMLCPHVKTHKSALITRLLMAAGIDYFKATPNEVEMLLSAGAKKIFVSYPLLADTADRLAREVKSHPETTFFVQAAHRKHLDVLLEAAERHHIKWNYFIDLDVGMHRTGIAPELAYPFYQSVSRSEPLQFAGLHGYDGHNHETDPIARQKIASAAMRSLINVLREFEKNRVNVPQVITGGTPGFLEDLKVLKDVQMDSALKVSPGTWIYYDTKSHHIMPGAFEMAALILARVIDTPTRETATLNLGHKRWAIDQGPIEGFSVPEMKAQFWSEEHTVVSHRDGRLDIGDYVLIAPQHVCSTVNLWEYFTLLGPNGAIEIARCPIEGRNR